MKILTEEGLKKLVELININKPNKATTLEGYGITNAYTKEEIDEMFANIVKAEENEF